MEEHREDRADSVRDSDGKAEALYNGWGPPREIYSAARGLVGFWPATTTYSIW